jgi:PAS domain S-box-containing protein
MEDKYRKHSDKKMKAKYSRNICSHEVMRKSEQGFCSIFENAREGIYQASTEGRFITVNPAFSRIAGYDSPEELIESIEDMETQLYVHSEDYGRFLEIIENKGCVNGLEVELFKKDRSKFLAITSARAVRDEQGRILYTEGFIEDITLRRNVEEQLLQSIDNLRKAIRATIQVLISAVDAKDPYTAGHQIRCANIARTIASE